MPLCGHAVPSKLRTQCGHSGHGGPMAKHLTDAIVKRLPLPAKANQITYDDALAGFGMRITAGGSRSFILNYRTKAGRERRITIGSHPDWRTTAARDEARRLKQTIDRGGDPLADIEGDRGAPTVASLADRFEREHLPRKRAGTAADYRLIVSKHIRPHFGLHTKVADVSLDDVEKLHRKITARGHLHRANRTVAVLSKMFSLAIRWRMRPDNPCKGLERNQETKRRRYLSADELSRLLAALGQIEDKQAANVIRLLLLSGARRGETLVMRWADLDLTAGKWVKPAATTKQKLDHEVPLSAAALKSARGNPPPDELGNGVPRHG